MTNIYNNWPILKWEPESTYVLFEGTLQCGKKFKIVDRNLKFELQNIKDALLKENPKTKIFYIIFY